ncbi:MAG: protein phosphatase 2C domain-containing protein [Ignavibacteriales bacterium]|nr:protein phosphatase 2C domain-containing protein [Ignavibacteriales bacterium]MCF8306319.1 protein phosphatase 2C domain-containing protein [Ignavibacteriales bacterium]MCF8316040.1 protein phosphatase 2C domain-containing protein [Ignavibacteriales bacterium]MCF8437634.1 protein phosphatase 2C domain-containing protein [Ignavibacteriales bacterium]
MIIKHSIARSIRGLSHFRCGSPNQDSILITTYGPRQIAACIADGHGSSNCFRSHLGSLYATEIFAGVVNDILSFASYDEVKIFAKSIPSIMVSKWRKRVDSNLITSPYANHETNESIMKNPYLAYGSTFLGCYICSEYAICLQIGDGEMFASYSNGKIKHLVPGDERLIGNETTSLCLPGAEKDFRVAVIDLTNEIYPEIIILASDGLSQSYAQDSDLFKWCSDMKEIYKEEGGTETIETNLGIWLDDVSSGASADDISMAVIRLEKEIKHNRIFHLFRRKKKRNSYTNNKGETNGK